MPSARIMRAAHDRRKPGDGRAARTPIGLILAIMAATGVWLDAQAPEWRRACNPSPFLIGAGTGGRGSTTTPATAGATLAELLALRDISVTAGIDVARCHAIQNDPALAGTSASQALERLRGEPPVVEAAPAAASQPTLPVAGREVPRPAKTRDVPPVHPSDFDDVGLNGLVFIEAVIDREGRVRNPAVTASIPALDPYALEAVRQWCYAPTLRDGKPVEVAITLLVGFGPDPAGQPVNALDAARYYYSRGQRADAAGWLSRAVDLLRAEESEWASYSKISDFSGGGRASQMAPSIVSPTRTSGVPPAYPRLARAAKAQGVTIIEAVIGKDGRVHRARVLRSEPLLAYAALRAVKAWEYRPALIDGIPTDVKMLVTVTFALN